MKKMRIKSKLYALIAAIALILPFAIFPSPQNITARAEAEGGVRFLTLPTARRIGPFRTA